MSDPNHSTDAQSNGRFYFCSERKKMIAVGVVSALSATLTGVGVATMLLYVDYPGDSLVSQVVDEILVTGFAATLGGIAGFTITVVTVRDNNLMSKITNCYARIFKNSEHDHEMLPLIANERGT